ncbi:hypothetical protein [Amycolatopsis circi]|uniref:hypothetical protein n=1 Tax=Amycolatopsis circi TaxID=871959 RepID=UPI000E240C4C|nr:hypothetical protein [Amycolatopsis circi]
MDDQDDAVRQLLANTTIKNGLTLPSGRKASGVDDEGEPPEPDDPGDDLAAAARFTLARINEAGPTASVPEGYRDLEGRRSLIEVWQANRWHRDQPDPLYTRLPFLLARAWCTHPDYDPNWNYR